MTGPTGPGELARAPSAVSGGARRRWGWTSDRWAAATFVLVLLIAVPAIRFQNRHLWFFLDEWDYLAGRSLGSLDDLLRSHNGHWSTVPIVVYRVLFRLAGLRHYWPYQAVSIGVHLAIAFVLRSLMRRCGAGSWIATAAATLFVFLGSGRINIAWAFQIGFTFSVLFGLLYLVLVDHDGAFDRRDGLGVLFGFASLASHGPGLAVVTGVMVTVWLRRGWRQALPHVVAMGFAFLTWYLTYGIRHQRPDAASPSATLTFAWRMMANLPVQLGQGPVAGAVFAAVAVGAAAVVIRRDPRELRGSLAPLVGLTVAAALLAMITSVGRAGTGPAATPTEGRYVYLLAALLIPVAAVALSRWVGPAHARFGPWSAVVVGLFLIGLPGNVAALGPTGADRYLVGSEDRWRQLATLSSSGDYPRSARPAPFEAPEVTVGWLQDTVAGGRISPSVEVTARVRADAELAMLFQAVADPPVGACRSIPPGQDFTVLQGQVIRVDGSHVTLTRLTGGAPAASSGFVGDGRIALAASTGPMELRPSFLFGITNPPAVCG